MLRCWGVGALVCWVIGVLAKSRFHRPVYFNTLPAKKCLLVTCTTHRHRQRQAAEKKAFDDEKAAKREALKQRALAKKKARELAKRQAAEAKEAAL